MRSYIPIVTRAKKELIENRTHGPFFWIDFLYLISIAYTFFFSCVALRHLPILADGRGGWCSHPYEGAIVMAYPQLLL
jgi:hypothetical protein